MTVLHSFISIFKSFHVYTSYCYTCRSSSTTNRPVYSCKYLHFVQNQQRSALLTLGANALRLPSGERLSGAAAHRQRSFGLSGRKQSPSQREGEAWRCGGTRQQAEGRVAVGSAAPLTPMMMMVMSEGEAVTLDCRSGRAPVAQREVG